LDVIGESLHPEAADRLGKVNADNRRRFVTCSVRLSKEKNPFVFVQLMLKLGGTMSRLGLVPLLCGAASDDEYAKKCREILLLSYPDACVIGDFLGPRQLASIFAHSYINFHPCKYDAFGMTAVEASAFGAPSLINCKDVGATEFLKADGFLAVDFNKSLDEIAADVDNILSNAERIAAVREEAYQRAMSWDEDASGRTIFSRLRALV
jgi:glycosyltransferase involved in cell wall biosynthesis